MLNNNLVIYKVMYMKFSGRVIEAMRKIPRGRVTTYKEIAHYLGCKAYRAVGNAVGANPYAPIVPCHRVVKSNGTVGNYGSGAKKKIKLLRREGIKTEGNGKDARIVNFDKVLFKFR